MTGKKVPLQKVAFLIEIWPKNISKILRLTLAVASEQTARARLLFGFFPKVSQPAQIYRTLGLPERSLRQQ